MPSFSFRLLALSERYQLLHFLNHAFLRNWLKNDPIWLHCTVICSSGKLLSLCTASCRCTRHLSWGDEQRSTVKGRESRNETIKRKLRTERHRLRITHKSTKLKLKAMSGHLETLLHTKKSCELQTKRRCTAQVTSYRTRQFFRSSRLENIPPPPPDKLGDVD